MTKLSRCRFFFHQKMSLKNSEHKPAWFLYMQEPVCTAEDMKPTWSLMEIWYLHTKCMNSYTDIKVDMSRAVQLQGTENAEWPERKGCMSKHSINRPKCRLTWENINFLLLNAVVEGEKKKTTTLSLWRGVFLLALAKTMKSRGRERHLKRL